MKRWLPPTLASLILAAVLVLLTLDLFSERRSLDTWRSAMVEGNYPTAERLTVGHDFAALKTQVETFKGLHGKVKGVSTSNVPPFPRPGSDELVISRMRFEWKDGFTRCVRVQVTRDNKIKVLNDGFHVCESDA